MEAHCEMPPLCFLWLTLSFDAVCNMGPFCSFHVPCEKDMLAHYSVFKLHSPKAETSLNPSFSCMEFFLSYCFSLLLSVLLLLPYFPLRLTLLFPLLEFKITAPTRQKEIQFLCTDSLQTDGPITLACNKSQQGVHWHAVILGLCAPGSLRRFPVQSSSLW